MGTSKIVGIWIGVFVAIVVLSLGVWAFRVASSDLKGQGDAIINKNDEVNRVAAQERFEELYAEADKASDNIETMRAAAESNPKSNVAQTNLTGAITYCRGVVADYNAEARKYSSADFRAIDLPVSLDADYYCSDN